MTLSELVEHAGQQINIALNGKNKQYRKGLTKAYCSLVDIMESQDKGEKPKLYDVMSVARFVSDSGIDIGNTITLM